MGCCSETEDINSSGKTDPCRLITWLLHGPSSHQQTVWKQNISIHTAWLISILANHHTWLWQSYSMRLLFHCLFQMNTRGLQMSLYSQKLTTVQPLHDSLSISPLHCVSEIISISCFLVFEVNVLLLSEQHLTARYLFWVHHAKTRISIHIRNYILLETGHWLMVLLLLGKPLIALLLLSLTTPFYYRRDSMKRKPD